jgi:hypothetical protein
MDGRMEPLLVLLTFLASVGLGLVAAYVTLSILLSAMQRGVMPEARKSAA